jgi:hypothetical protein
VRPSSVSDSGVRFQGDSWIQKLKQLLKELGEAINKSLNDSEPIAEVVARIKKGGYDIVLVLEATIGVSKTGEPTTRKKLRSSLRSARTRNSRSAISAKVNRITSSQS